MQRTVNLGDRKVTVVGTAHVSGESRDEVREVIEDVKPDLVGVELDEKRFQSLEDEDGWRDLDIAEAIREGRGYLLLLNLLLSIYQRRLGEEQGVKPGTEMMEAVEVARENGVEFALIDRDISDTFDRLRDEMTLREKLRFASSFLVKTEEMDVEELKDRDVLSSLVKQLEDDFPSIKKTFLDERNRHMREKLLEKDFEHAVVVVGAAHVEGLVAELQDDLSPGTREPGRHLPWIKILSYGFPLAVIAMLGYSFLHYPSTGLKGTQFWILSNGILAMFGAIAARSHLTTWMTSFLAAPLTSLDPAIGAGMVAAYAEARLYPPKVEELEEVVYLDRYRELWGNQVGRILLTFIFVTVGSALATFIGAGYIASLLAA